VRARRGERDGEDGRGAAIDWLIVGLGNPGREYARTPHNVGFMVAEALAERWGLPRMRARFGALLSEGRVGTGPQPSARVALLLPQTYMNEAGRAVGPARGAYRLPLERVLVVHDEIDLPFGELRARLGGGLAGHNGLKSLKRELGGADFWRVRVGVGRPDSTDPEVVSAHVLGRFRQSPEEVGELVERACAEVERIVSEREDGDEA
jgi:PTH1 family peptidyl-tRNA hydrolase